MPGSKNLGFFSTQPKDILLHIFSFLDSKDIPNIYRLNKEFYWLAKQAALLAKKLIADNLLTVAEAKQLAAKTNLHTIYKNYKQFDLELFLEKARATLVEEYLKSFPVETFKTEITTILNDHNVNSDIRKITLKILETVEDHYTANRFIHEIPSVSAITSFVNAKT